MVKLRQFRPENEESEVAAIEELVAKDLSEPYSIYVYLYFLKEWPQLSYIAEDDDGKIIGCIVCSLRVHRNRRRRGYIAMLAVREDHRGQGIAKKLIKTAVENLVSLGADEVTLETEISNAAALGLYENMGFLRTRRMARYYLNSSDAFRLVLPLTAKSVTPVAFLPVLEGINPELPDLGTLSIV